MIWIEPRYVGCYIMGNMTKAGQIVIAFLLSVFAARADLALEQASSDTKYTQLGAIKLHGDMMRLDQPGMGFSVIVNLRTRDSYTLLTNKTYLMKFGSEVRWEMGEERKYTHGTNDMDAPPAPAVATGKSELVNGRKAEIYTWSGGHGLKQILWVDRNYPDFQVIRMELSNLDRFNESGPHPNAQPLLSPLPGMVLRTVSVAEGHSVTNTLLSVSLEPMDPALFEIPKGYKLYERSQNKSP